MNNLKKTADGYSLAMRRKNRYLNMNHSLFAIQWAIFTGDRA